MMELLVQLLEIGGVPAAIILAMKMLWNGTGKRIERIEESVTDGFKSIGSKLDTIANHTHDNTNRIVKLEERNRANDQWWDRHISGDR